MPGPTLGKNGGPQEVVRRAKAYWQAGADLIFLEAPQSLDELKYYASELVPCGIRISANMLDGGRTPISTFQELEEMGYSRCSVPVMTTYAAAMGLKTALEQMMRDGNNQHLDGKIIPFQEFNKLIGLPKIREIEKSFLTGNDIEQKYRSMDQLMKEQDQGR